MITFLRNQKYDFNHEIYEKNLFLNHQIEYQVEMAREAAILGKRVVMIVDCEQSSLLVDKWKSLPAKGFNLADLVYLDATKKRFNENANYFNDYLEKLALIDVLNNGKLNDTFVEYKVNF